MICSRCKQEKVADQFYYHKSGKKIGKPQAYCKVCANQAQSKWSKDNRQRKADINRGWRKRNYVRRHAMLMASNAMWKAIRNGSLKRGHSCAFCDSTENIIIDNGTPLIRSQFQNRKFHSVAFIRYHRQFRGMPSLVLPWSATQKKQSFKISTVECLKRIPYTTTRQALPTL
jgi:hypothetical protein